MKKDQNNPMDPFLYAIRSPVIKQRYIKNLGNFLDFVGINGTLEEKASEFNEQGKRHENSWIFNQVMKYMSYQKARVEKNEISANSIKNYYKPIKLFLSNKEPY